MRNLEMKNFNDILQKRLIFPYKYTSQIKNIMDEIELLDSLVDNSRTWNTAGLGAQQITLEVEKGELVFYKNKHNHVYSIAIFIKRSSLGGPLKRIDVHHRNLKEVTDLLEEFKKLV